MGVYADSYYGGAIYCLDADSGEIIWECQIRGLWGLTVV